MNNVNSNHIITDSNHVDLNKSIPDHLETINDSAEVWALNQLLSWDRYSTDAAKPVDNITQLDYVPLIHTSHTPYIVHSLYLCPTIPAQQECTYCTSEPPSHHMIH